MSGSALDWTFTAADPLSLGLFCVFALGMLGLCLFAASRIDRSTLVGFLLGICGFSVVVLSGLPKRYPIPTIPLMFAAILALSVWFAFSRRGRELSRIVPLGVLVGFQAFRFPLELILHHWAGLGTVPPTMTWSGQNWDVISGLIAIPFAFVKKREAAWIPTIVGLGLLLNVLRVVVMSSPFPFSWQLEQPLQLLLYLPYAYIGPLFVAPALIGHLVTLRALLELRTGTPERRRSR